MNAASPLHTVTRTITRDRLLKTMSRMVEITLAYPLPYKPERHTEMIIHVQGDSGGISEFRTDKDVSVISFFFLSDRVRLNLYVKGDEVLHAQVTERRQEFLPFKPPYVEAHVLFDGIDLGKFLRK